jgi:hypothetical protein
VGRINLSERREISMPYCTECGTQANPEANFCSACGHPLRGAQPAQGAAPAAASAHASESGRLEALELGPEIVDTETFFALCRDQPDEALLKIATLEVGVPELGNTFPVPLYKFLALARKTLVACESQGDQSDAYVRSLCTECLRAYPRARAAAKAADAEDTLEEPFVRSSLDAVAVLVEKDEPGRVQELLAETKLKYAMLANRVDIAKAVQNVLAGDEMLEALEFSVTAPFIIRAALLGRMVNLPNAKVLSIMLYEQTDVWGPSEKMNPIKGQLHLRKENVAGSQWRLLATPSEANEVLKAISD